MQNKTIIIYDSVSYFTKLIENKGFKIFPTFKKVNFLEKFLRKFSFITNIGLYFWFSDWKKNIKGANVIIIFATNRYDFIEYIAKKNSNARIIVWYWNPVFRCFDPEKLKYKNIEYWSFDKDDCNKYKLNYNTTFYFDNIELKKNIIKNDVIFLGADKGRYAKLKEIEELLQSYDLSTNFHVVPDKGEENPNNIQPLSYKKYLELISSSKVILDYLQEGQKGLTLRPMESIFFKKKLITNDINIRNENFYLKENIFIIGVDKNESLKSFVNLPYVDIDKEIVQHYDFNNWIERFNNNE